MPENAPGRRGLATVVVLLAVASVPLGCGGGAQPPRQPADGSPPAPAAARELHVAPNGSPDAPGTESKPLDDVADAVARLATTGGTVTVARGRYPRLVLTERLDAPVTVQGPERLGAGPPRRPRAARFAGAMLAGTTDLRLRAVGFDDTVTVGLHPVRKAEQPARRVTLDGVDITGSAGNCLTVRGARDVRLARSRIHDCFNAIGTSEDGADGGTPTERFTIEGNRLERLSGDGIDFSGTRDLTIEGNTIAGAVDPAAEVHNDGIQGIGNTRRTRIVGNTISDIRSQLVLIQGAIGTHDDILIAGNLMHGSGGPGLMISAARGAVVRDNTIWDTHYSALQLRNDTRHGNLVADAVVLRNLISGLVLDDTRPRVLSGNVISFKPYGFKLPAGNAVRARPPFVGAGDWRLRPGTRGPTGASLGWRTAP